MCVQDCNPESKCLIDFKRTQHVELGGRGSNKVWYLRLRLNQVDNKVLDEGGMHSFTCKCPPPSSVTFLSRVEKHSSLQSFAIPATEIQYLGIKLRI